MWRTKNWDSQIVVSKVPEELVVGRWNQARTLAYLDEFWKANVPLPCQNWKIPGLVGIPDWLSNEFWMRMKWFCQFVRCGRRATLLARATTANWPWDACVRDNLDPYMNRRVTGGTTGAL